ncbi:hypothetical protein ACFQZ4_36065 [Catellatospora coxensis]
MGRERELAELSSATARVRNIHGPGGVGKSALAIRLAHALADEHPDGQLYLDLQGSNPRLTPWSPATCSTVSCARWARPRATSPPTPPKQPGCSAPGWPGGGCWCCSTTPWTPPRCGRCCRAPPTAWCWSPAAAR